MTNNEKKSEVLKNKQNLILKDRKYLEITGVREVISYNEDKIILETTEGILDIKGQDLNLHNLNLDDEEIKIDGLIISLVYTDKKNEKGILKKLFK